MIKLLNKIKGMLMYIMYMYRVYEDYSVIEVLSVIHFNVYMLMLWFHSV